MKSLRFAFALILAGPCLSRLAVAHEGHEHADEASGPSHLVTPAAKDAAWVAEQKAKYPTNVCIVSEDPLGGDMGKPVDYIYRIDGKPDRLVTFCCKHCVKDFNAEPEKYLKILDDAAAKKNTAQPAAKS